MTKKELIEALKDVPDDFQVIMAGDGEGNNFSPLYVFSLGLYEPDTEYSGEYYEDEDKEGADDNCICFWPSN